MATREGSTTRRPAARELINRHAGEDLLQASLVKLYQAWSRVDVATADAYLHRQQRAVLVLRYWADLPEAEVADILGCTAGSVKTHAYRGIRALRRGRYHQHQPQLRAHDNHHRHDPRRHAEPDGVAGQV